ncbi:MAG TPA: hypothetical protein VGB46_02580, partial [Flavisolibacter sp.]
MVKLELADIQGLVARGYDELPSACFLLLKITDASLAKKYLQHLLDSHVVTPADKKHIKESHKMLESYDGGVDGEQVKLQPLKAMQVAFTSRGLRELKLPEETMAAFSREFIEG